MKRFLSLLILITIFNHVDLIAQSSKKTLIRSIKFIDLRNASNAPFWGYYREIPRLIMDAIDSGSVTSIIIDYDKKVTVVPLSVSQYKWKLAFLEYFKTSDDPSTGFLSPSDLPYIGLDQTISIIDGKECTQVHHVNFYSYENFSEDKKTRQYRFSVTWEDFIAVLKQRQDLLYAPNIYGEWWRGNVFITNERYFIDSKTSDFIELSRSYNISPKDFRNLNYVKTIDSLNKWNYDPSLMDLYLIEEKKDDYWNIKSLFFGTAPQDQSYLNEHRFGYEWTDFTTILKNKKAATSSNIYTLADAFLLKKFSYSDSIKSIQISKNGKFKNGDKDGSCSAILNESFINNLNAVTHTKFHTQMIESLYLGDTSNKHLNLLGHSIAELLYGYVLNGNLVAYTYDSRTPITIKTFKYNASQYLIVPEIMYESTYQKGDTVSLKGGDSWPFEKEYYIAQENFSGTDFYNDSSMIYKLKRYYPPLIPIKELSVVEFFQDITFNSEGNNKKYELQTIALQVSADGPSNLKGIQYPVCCVRWNELKALLLKDPRAIFANKGCQVNLIDLIENREYLSILLKTGYVEIEE